MLTKTTFDFSRRMRDFDMTNPVVVSTTHQGDPIVVYTNTFNGRDLTHVRTLYKGKGDVWCPGKGVSFPTEEFTLVLEKLIGWIGSTGGEPEAPEAQRVLTEADTPALAEITDAQWHVFADLANQLSPENLTCDGELSRAQVARNAKALRAAWQAAEKAVGRTVSEDEVWEHVRARVREAAPTAGFRVGGFINNPENPPAPAKPKRGLNALASLKMGGR